MDSRFYFVKGTLDKTAPSQNAELQLTVLGDVWKNLTELA